MYKPIKFHHILSIVHEQVRNDPFVSNLVFFAYWLKLFPKKTPNS